MNKNVKLKVVIIVTVLSAFVMSACSESTPNISSVSELNNEDKVIGVANGSIGMIIAEENYAESEIKYFTSNTDAFVAVQQGRVDAYFYDKILLEYALGSGLDGVHILDETVGETTDIAIGISKKTEITDLKQSLDEFVSEMQKNGILDDMNERWIINGDENMPEIKVPENPSVTIKIATTGTIAPFSYYKDGELTGYDIELVNRFAEYMNAKIEISVFDFNGLEAALEAGVVDCAFSNLNVTDERKLIMNFSQKVYETTTAVLVKGEVTD